MLARFQTISRQLLQDYISRACGCASLAAVNTFAAFTVQAISPSTAAWLYAVLAVRSLCEVLLIQNPSLQSHQAVTIRLVNISTAIAVCGIVLLFLVPLKIVHATPLAGPTDNQQSEPPTVPHNPSSHQSPVPASKCHAHRIMEVFSPLPSQSVIISYTLDTSSQERCTIQIDSRDSSAVKSEGRLAARHTNEVRHLRRHRGTHAVAATRAGVHPGSSIDSPLPVAQQDSLHDEDAQVALHAIGEKKESELKVAYATFSVVRGQSFPEHDRSGRWIWTGFSETQTLASPAITQLRENHQVALPSNSRP